MNLLATRFSYIIQGSFIYLILLLSFLSGCTSDSFYTLKDASTHITISTPQYVVDIQKQGFRYQLSHVNGEVIAPYHSVSGLVIEEEGNDRSFPIDTRLIGNDAERIELEVETDQGLTVKVVLFPDSTTVKMEVRPIPEGIYTLIARTGAVGPAYGMGDLAAFGPGNSNVILDDFIRDPAGGDNGRQRMISNFVIFPQQGLATVNIEPSSSKIIHVTEEEHAQGAHQVATMKSLYYFIGSPKEIYRAYLNVRNAEGYPVYLPKHEWFGVGWEAFGALAWNTNHETVKQNIDQYLEEGYPLSWMVVGSGFWPRGTGEFDAHGTPYGSESTSEAAKKLQATTSFGMWDKILYPNPKAFIDYFHSRGLIFTIGLRIGFIPGGPFTEEGLAQQFFLRDSVGQAKLYKVGFPRVPVFLLDSQNPNAVSWYVDLCKKWLDDGVDGFKEDLFHWPTELRDDLIDPVNRQLMDQGVFIMGRNNYLGSPADIHRFDDFNYNQFQDRGPINGLAYAYSGFPNVYPDIVGGTGLATGRFGKEPGEKLRRYLIRYAQYAALNPSMAFGYGPWNFSEETHQLCLAAAQLHHRLKPHIYSNAVKAFHTGFPYPLTPLPLVYPEDEQVYGLADTVHRSYQWMIGESLMAAPLFGNDCATTTSRTVYLPQGKWIDYEDGRIFEGPTRLENFEIPLDKIPLFVGGTGFVVEQEKDTLWGRLYPITKKAEIDFWHEDGQTQSHIHLDIADWENMKILDVTTGEEVKYDKIRYAYQFEIQSGSTYQIQ